jgi:hypothetical protein
MLRRWFRNRRRAGMLRADAHAVHVQLGPLLSKLRGHSPWTGHALRPFALATILNDLVINRRRAYLEFGGGISTLLVAKVAELDELDVDLVTVEHDPAWLELLQGVLAREGLGDRVRLLLCPLVDRTEPAPFGALRWYDERPLLEGLAGRPRDLVLVDGPPGGGRRLARYPALPFLKAHGLLAERASVLLDDVDRPGERTILRSWSARCGVAFQVLHGRVAWSAAPGSFDARVD